MRRKWHDDRITLHRNIKRAPQLITMCPVRVGMRMCEAAQTGYVLPAPDIFENKLGACHVINGFENPSQCGGGTGYAERPSR